MPTILLLRHGETHWNRLHRIQGHVDAPTPLTLRGVAQAKAYGATVRRLMGDSRGWRVVSSPLARCVQTTGVLCETAGLEFDDVVLDDRLKEVGTGSFSGWYKPDLKRRHPELMTGSGLASWYFRCPGGETWHDLERRLGAWLGECRPGDKLVVVTHGVAGKVLRGLYGGLAPAAVLAEDAPQDALFVLAGGTVERVACTPVPAEC
jgi:probable phosphoglycerate mutase